MFTLLLFALRRMAEPTPFVLSFFPSPEISSFWRASIAITPSGTQKVLPTLVGRKYSLGSSPLTSHHPGIPTLLHCSSGSRSSPDIFFAPSSLVLYCSWEVFQDLGSDHLPILLSVSLSPVFPSFNFQKARWDDFASYFDSHYTSAVEYSPLSLSSAAAFSSPLWR